MHAARRLSRKRTVTEGKLAARPTRSLVVVPQQCGVLLGRLVGLTAAGEPLVEFMAGGSRHVSPARASTSFRSSDIGRQVTLVFIDGDPNQPVLSGLLQQVDAPDRVPAASGRPLSITLDGERLELSAFHEIVLRCGKASIKLSRDGRLELRGTDLLSRSSSVNRIKGGSVKIN